MARVGNRSSLWSEMSAATQDFEYPTERGKATMSRRASRGWESPSRPEAIRDTRPLLQVWLRRAARSVSSCAPTMTQRREDVPGSVLNAALELDLQDAYVQKDAAVRS